MKIPRDVDRNAFFFSMSGDGELYCPMLTLMNGNVVGLLVGNEPSSCFSQFTSSAVHLDPEKKAFWSLKHSSVGRDIYFRGPRKAAAVHI